MISQKKLSIIIPVIEVRENLVPLKQRIDQILKKENIDYEIILIKNQKNLEKQLTNAVSFSGSELVCFYDPEKGYPPEAIVGIYKKLHNHNADIVIAGRKKRLNLSFGRLFHKIDYDNNSGIWLLKREVIIRLNTYDINFSPGLEYLIIVRNSGYKIINYEINPHHISKIKNKKNSFLKNFLHALSLNLTQKEMIPFHPDKIRNKGFGFHHKGREFIHHTPLNLKSSAFHRFSEPQLILVILLIELLILGLIINWHLTVVILIAALTTLYFADLLFNLFLVYRSYTISPELKIKDTDIHNLDERQWPVYTVLCPLYNEWKILPQFVRAMDNLDYPKDKLQIMLLLEEDDKETIDIVKKLELPAYFEYLIVPHSKPKTKPKACNYGLRFAKGEYVVIYDAEDIPDQLQLKKAIIAFEQAGRKTVCVQAKLNFYNPRQNLITRIFTAEYSLWFDLVLTGLQSINAPIPLGGTSNHFRIKDLIMLKGWDSFNVTEDADLGMRLVKKGFKTALIDSVTLEEANSNAWNWFSQRSRWIKGYIQTYFVHMRNPGEFFKNWNDPHFFTFQLVIGGKVLSMLINPLMWIITISYFTARPLVGAFIESFYPTPVLYMAIFSLLLGNFLYLYYYMIGCIKRDHDDIVKYAVFVPFYWLAMSWAAFIAIYKFIISPHHWAKTKHGLHIAVTKNANYISGEVALLLKKIRNISKKDPARKLSVSICIPAYNESKNIRNILNALQKQITQNIVINKIVVVSSGSTDNTDKIVTDYALKNPKISLIRQNDRKGKASAINAFLKTVDDEVVVIESADTIPVHNTIQKLCEPFLKNEKIGMTGGAPVPVNDPDTFLGYIIHAWWWFHRNIPRFGEIIAFRNIIPQIVETTAVDEAYIQAKMVRMGYGVIPVNDAVVKNKGAETISDLIKQRRRVMNGHARLLKNEGVKIDNMTKSSLALLLFKFKMRNLKEFSWLLGGIGIEIYARLLGFIDYHISRKNPYVWDMASSTKDVSLSTGYQQEVSQV